MWRSIVVISETAI